MDGWDCLENQEFPSLEGFAFVAQQMFQLGKPPDRYTPEYMILKKYKEWEIRRWVYFPPIARAVLQHEEAFGAAGAEQSHSSSCFADTSPFWPQRQMPSQEPVALRQQSACCKTTWQAAMTGSRQSTAQRLSL